VKPGDTVAEDQALADVMTDKATVEIPSPIAGKVQSLGGELGQTMAVGADLIRIEVEGEGNVAGDAAVTQRGAPAPTPSKPGGARDDRTQGKAAGSSAPESEANDAEARAPRASGAPASAPRAVPSPEAVAPRRPEDKPIASPAVRRRAWELGVELRYLRGTGPAGRITHADLDAYAGGSGVAAGRAGARYQMRNDEEAVKVIGLRRQIAQKMQDSKRRIPHYSYVEEIDVTELEALRAQLNARWGADRGKLTVLPLLVRAIVLAVREFPQVNALFDDEAGVLTRHGAVHVGIATQTDGGLLVPVVTHAEARDLWSCAAEIVRLSGAARESKAARKELSGSTITITSLGALGGIVTTPVINAPEVAIVGVNRIVERPMIHGGAVVARKMMNLSSSFDHRVVDGMIAAGFVQSIRRALECPATLFVE
jgi:2-oxoisovalerate dehydrogenase E2 component (dihydrolipoyl transacylase)